MRWFASLLLKSIYKISHTRTIDVNINARLINAFVSTGFHIDRVFYRVMVTFDNSYQWQIHFFYESARLINRTRLYPNKEKYLTVPLSYPIPPVRMELRLVSGHATRSGCSPYIYRALGIKASENIRPETR